jgi:hypothetical protein
MAAVSIGLVIAGVIGLAVGTTADGDREQRVRRVSLGIGWGSCLVFVGIWAALLFAQPTVCDVLGGEWFQNTEACRHEFGGNGSNDPDTGPWPWT